MTEEEFRAQMGQGAVTGGSPPTAYPPPPTPAVYNQVVKPPNTYQNGGGWVGKKPGGGGFSPVKLPLVVRQSKKDGRFYLAGSISFAVEVDQLMFQRISETGQGVNEFKAGELVVWPAFDKTRQHG